MKPKIDLLISDLCNEIDEWKNEAFYWREKYKESVKDFNELTSEQLETSKRGVANALMFMMSVSDNPDGSLSISKENRESLINSL